MSGFRKFILRGNLVDLAVAVVVGTQFSSLVKTFVTAFVNPLLALVGGKPDFSSLVLTINDAKFRYGLFLTEVISFLISAAVVYFVIVLPAARLLALFERDVEATERDCPECTMSIPIRARRCPECTTQLAAPSGPPPTGTSPHRV
ncbi:large conductance mechanosensitive channel protein MscL [Actinomadura sp. DC4]|uniref:large conductance mechanosensitive channel protein MscL n=1 Tax=Actinomadura sp. DC4 TaxID=3055069 RepID=UPI0025B0ACF8|nr:large conductance mechanosensitive channel protein MscL [Actinomadura sp. DC4]MDN3351167.1 large conductance mechanosensitive channel protein MscL [Actinomadura sp. DC4]